jgi:hypothetical protein
MTRLDCHGFGEPVETVVPLPPVRHGIGDEPNVVNEYRALLSDFSEWLAEAGAFRQGMEDPDITDYLAEYAERQHGA